MNGIKLIRFCNVRKQDRVIEPMQASNFTTVRKIVSCNVHIHYAMHTCKQMLINPADGRRYSSTAHDLANAKVPPEPQRSAKINKNVTVTQ